MNQKISPPGASACCRHIFLLVFSLLALVPAKAQDPESSTNGAPAQASTNAAPAQPSDPTNAETIRSLLQLQEQLHATQLLIEQNRETAEKSSAKEAELLTARLQSIEQSLEVQRARELEAMQSSNRVMLIVAGSFASVGFLSMLLMAYFQWRAVNRLADIAAEIPNLRALGPAPTVHALGMGETGLATLQAPDQASFQLSGAMAKLEQRLRSLESLSRKHLPAPESPEPPEPHSTAAAPPTAAKGAEGNGARPVTVPGLLAKAQTALETEEYESALRLVDEALQQDPRNTDALVKKGSCLESLRKLNEAVACYDQAISIDKTLTVAYLHKGGLFNRMERFSEALQCYEQALRTQEHKAAKAESVTN